MVLNFCITFVVVIMLLIWDFDYKEKNKWVKTQLKLGDHVYEEKSWRSLK